MTASGRPDRRSERQSERTVCDATEAPEALSVGGRRAAFDDELGGSAQDSPLWAEDQVREGANQGPVTRRTMGARGSLGPVPVSPEQVRVTRPDGTRPDGTAAHPLRRPKSTSSPPGLRESFEPGTGLGDASQRGWSPRPRRDSLPIGVGSISEDGVPPPVGVGHRSVGGAPGDPLRPGPPRTLLGAFGGPSEPAVSAPSTPVEPERWALEPSSAAAALPAGPDAAASSAPAPAESRVSAVTSALPVGAGGPIPSLPVLALGAEEAAEDDFENEATLVVQPRPSLADVARVPARTTRQRSTMPASVPPPPGWSLGAYQAGHPGRVSVQRSVPPVAGVPRRPSGAFHPRPPPAAAVDPHRMALPDLSAPPPSGPSGSAADARAAWSGRPGPAPSVVQGASAPAASQAETAQVQPGFATTSPTASAAGASASAAFAEPNPWDTPWDASQRPLHDAAEGGASASRQSERQPGREPRSTSMLPLLVALVISLATFSLGYFAFAIFSEQGLSDFSVGTDTDGTTGAEPAQAGEAGSTAAVAGAVSPAVSSAEAMSEPAEDATAEPPVAALPPITGDPLAYLRGFVADELSAAPVAFTTCADDHCLRIPLAELFPDGNAELGDNGVSLLAQVAKGLARLPRGACQLSVGVSEQLEGVEERFRPTPRVLSALRASGLASALEAAAGRDKVLVENNAPETGAAGADGEPVAQIRVQVIVEVDPPPVH